MAAHWLVTPWAALVAASGTPSGFEGTGGLLVGAVILTGVVSLALFGGCIALSVFVARRLAAQKRKMATVAGGLLGILAGVGVVVATLPFVFMSWLFLLGVVTAEHLPQAPLP